MQEELVSQIIRNTAEGGVRKFVQKASEQQLIVCYLKKLCHYNMVTDKTGYLYVKKPLEVERPETFAFRCAGQIKIGDEIVVRENYKMIPGKVIKISNFIMQGNHILFTCISILFCCF